MAKKFPTWIVILAGMLACLGVGLCTIGMVWFAGSSLAGAGRSAPAVGEPAADFTLTSMQDDAISLSMFRGRPVLVHFFTTWCGPCREEMPLIQGRFEQLYPRLIVLAVDEGDSRNAVDAYVREHGLTFYVLLDPWTQTGNAFGVGAYPTSVFVDADGIVRFVQVGAMDLGMLNDNLSLIGIR